MTTRDGIKSFLCVVAVVGIVAAMSGTVQAAALIYEPFADSDPSLNGNAVGTGLEGTWWASSNAYLVEEGTMSWGNLITNDNQVYYSGQGAVSANIETTVDGNVLSDAGLLDDSATLWFSILLKTPVDGSSNPDTGFAIATDPIKHWKNNNIPLNGSGIGDGVGWAIKSGALRAAFWDNKVKQQDGTGISVATDTEMLIVGQAIWGVNSTADDTINLYLPDTDMNMGSVVSTKTGVVDQSAFSLITTGLKTNTYSFDEIRVGASYADVTPTFTAFTSVATGLWSVDTTWTKSQADPANFPNADSAAVVADTHTVTVDSAATAAGLKLTVQSGGIAQVDGNLALTQTANIEAGGTLNIAGTLSATVINSSGTVNIGSAADVSGVGTVNVNGGVTGTTGALTLDKVNLNGGSLSMGGNVTTGIFTGNSGTVSMGGNTLDAEELIVNGDLDLSTGSLVTTGITATDATLTLGGPVAVDTLELDGGRIAGDVVTASVAYYFTNTEYGDDLSAAVPVTIGVDNLTDETVKLTGANTGYTGTISVRRGAVEFNENCGNMADAKVVFNNDNYRMGVLQSSGAVSLEIGADVEFAGGGGFAAVGDGLEVTLVGDGGDPLVWSSSTNGFNNKQLQFGSATATAAAELTNDITLNVSPTIRLSNNPNSGLDMGVMSGDIIHDGTPRKISIQGAGGEGKATLAFTGANRLGPSTPGDTQDGGTLSVGGHIVRAIDGQGLPADAHLQIGQDGIFESSGTFTRTVGAVNNNGNAANMFDGQVTFDKNSWGFAAGGGDLDLCLNATAIPTSGPYTDYPWPWETQIFGSETATGVLTVHHNLARGDGGLMILNVFGNPDVTTDKIVIKGNMISANSYVKIQGNGEIEIEGDVSAAAGGNTFSTEGSVNATVNGAITSGKLQVLGSSSLTINGAATANGEFKVTSDATLIIGDTGSVNKGPWLNGGTLVVNGTHAWTGFRADGDYGLTINGTLDVNNGPADGSADANMSGVYCYYESDGVGDETGIRILSGDSTGHTIGVLSGTLRLTYYDALPGGTNVNVMGDGTTLTFGRSTDAILGDLTIDESLEPVDDFAIANGGGGQDVSFGNISGSAAIGATVQSVVARESISPTDASGALGELLIETNVTLEPTAKLNIRFQGTGSDVLNVDGDLTLGDILNDDPDAGIAGDPDVVLDFLPGTDASSKFGGTYTIATYTGTLTGTLDTSDMLGNIGERYIQGVDYSTQGEIKVSLYNLGQGDINLDGYVDVGDLSALSSGWDPGGVNENSWLTGDLDFSGFVDIGDLSELSAGWAPGGVVLTSGDLDTTAIPEPGSAIMLLLAAAGLLAYRRRR